MDPPITILKKSYIEYITDDITKRTTVESERLIKVTAKNYDAFISPTILDMNALLGTNTLKSKKVRAYYCKNCQYYYKRMSFKYSTPFKGTIFYELCGQCLQQFVGVVSQGELNSALKAITHARELAEEEV